MKSVSKRAAYAALAAGMGGAAPLLITTIDPSAVPLVPAWGSAALLLLAAGLGAFAWRTRGVL